MADDGEAQESIRPATGHWVIVVPVALAAAVRGLY